MNASQAQLPKNGSHKLEQRQFLMTLQRHIGLSFREMAERSRAIDGRPDLHFTHQAISKWFRGASQPSAEGRELLSLLLESKRN